MNSIYLDHAAATPVDPAVYAAMQPYMTERFYNPSALYNAARDVKKDVETARALVARQLGCRPVEIVFTAGGTEANNMAIHGIMRQYPNGTMIATAIEHDAVLEPARRYACSRLPVAADGLASVEALEQLIDDKTVLVSIMYANNELGTVQPIRRVGQLIARIRRGRLTRGVKMPLYLHTDACQAANYLDLQTARLGVDMMTLNGGKIYGPKQSGVLYVRAGIVLDPIIVGGGQEHNVRSGTENVPAIIGFATALEKAQSIRNDESRRLGDLQQLFYALLQEKLPTSVINGSRTHRLPNNVHVTFQGQDNERLMMQLDESGVMAATGSACSASSEEPSHVLSAIGLTDAEAQASLRFTMGRATTEADVRYTVDTLQQIIA